jgi:hypothetical protein
MRSDWASSNRSNQVRELLRIKRLGCWQIEDEALEISSSKLARELHGAATVTPNPTRSKEGR